MLRLLRSIFINLRGCASLILYIMNLLVHAIVILWTALIVLFIPKKSWRMTVQKHCLQRLPACFAYFNRLISSISTRHLWNVSGTGTLKHNGWYAMISNHRSWLDILVLGNVFHRKIPPLKFFMKKELLWQLPLAGLACYALGYPFMSRHSHAEIRKNPQLKGKDIETTKKACRHLRDYPTTLINFVEGTRFTKKKQERQQSPFHHLLKPHTGGIAVVLNELHDVLEGIVSVVICYPKKSLTVWDFCCGRFEKIIVHYEVLPITPDLIGDYYNDRQFRSHLQQMMNDMWQRNDALLGAVRQ